MLAHTAQQTIAQLCAAAENRKFLTGVWRLLHDDLTAALGSKSTRLWKHRWEGVPVGSSLSLDLGCTNAQVEMQTGGHEEVAFGVEIPTHMPACDTPFILSAVEHDQRLAIGIQMKDGTVPLLDHHEAWRINAAVPPRYFSYALSTSEGDVSLADAKEAGYVHAVTSGGNISGNAIQAVDVGFNAGAGGIKVKSVAGSTVDVRSSSLVQIQSLTGFGVDIDAGVNGEIRLGGCNAHTFRARCRSLQASAIRCTDSAEVTVSPQGTVKINGIDGVLSLDCLGSARLDLQVNEGARCVHIKAPEGLVDGEVSVDLYIAPSLAVDWVLPKDDAGRMHFDIPSDWSSISNVLFKRKGEERAAGSAGQDRSNLPSMSDVQGTAKDTLMNDSTVAVPQSRLQRSSEPGRCIVSVKGGGLSLRVQRRTWAEAMAQHLAAGGYK